jgi:hypothetical protein
VIEEYNGWKDIVVRFVDSGNLVRTRYELFKKGIVKNPYDKSVYDVGFIGVGEYRPKINGERTKQYAVWHSMLERCYSGKLHKKRPTYSDCTLAKEWHCFQNFARWYDDNYYEVNGERMALDKDILLKGNKVYSPQTCIFVPQSINLLFVKGDSMRGEYCIGVSLHKITNKFQVYCSILGDNQYLGLFNTYEEAFQIYKEFKEKSIKRIANEYKGKIPYSLYASMMNYIVERND